MYRVKDKDKTQTGSKTSKITKLLQIQNQETKRHYFLHDQTQRGLSRHKILHHEGKNIRDPMKNHRNNNAGLVLTNTRKKTGPI
jgi:ABC-type antimicrobial peptide transport system permease subunit